MGVTAVERRVRTAVIVDDTPDVRLLLRRALERDGDIRIVGEAGDGRSGVDTVRRTQPDVVLLDLSMPVMDGLEALPGIRTASPASRIIVLSALESRSMAERAFERGAHGYLMKGTSPSGILSYVRTMASMEEPSLPSARRAASSPARPGDLVGAQRQHGRSSGELGTLVAELAPVGLLLVEDAGSPSARIGYVNRTATRLLGLSGPLSGGVLAGAVPALALLLMSRCSDLDTSTEVRDGLVVPQGRLEVTLTRTDANVLVTLHRPVEAGEASRLRQAIATTAHEIRNPVTVLNGVAAVLREAGVPSSQEQLGKLLAAVARQASVLDRLTEDLLTATQTQRGSLRLDVVPVELAPVLADAVNDLGHGIGVDIRGADEVRVRADATRLSQMVANLLGNAVKYGAPPYVIAVSRSAGWTGPLVEIAVEDCGAGVPEDFRDQLFEEFTRAEDARSRGTGLGLFLVRSLAQAQDGSADYRPRPGGGSAFTITLPEA
jgi:signal transduction histidine kinase/DNA-binding NarL/FixJ family response regulator